MLARVAAGIGGLVVALAPIPLLFLPALVLDGAVSNECIFDGGGEDCYEPGLRIAMGVWGLAGIAGVLALVYVGGSGVYYALTGRKAWRLGTIAVAGVVLELLTWLLVLPFVVS